MLSGKSCVTRIGTVTADFRGRIGGCTLLFEYNDAGKQCIKIGEQMLEMNSIVFRTLIHC